MSPIQENLVMSASEATPLIDMKNVRFGYGERLIIDGLSLTVRKGEIVALMGGSGSGKTTLLGLLGGRIQPISGEIHVAGQNVPTLARKELYTLRRRIGMLFQFGALFTDLNVFDNVAFPYREQTDLPEPVIRDLVLMKLEAVGLRGAHPLMPSELSGGMARRVALARAVALDPMLMLYDEHDLTETLRIADRVVMLASGRIHSDLSPEGMQSSTDPFVRQFADGLPDGPVPFHHPARPYAEELFAR